MANKIDHRSAVFTQGGMQATHMHTIPVFCHACLAASLFHNLTLSPCDPHTQHMTDAS